MTVSDDRRSDHSKVWNTDGIAKLEADVMAKKKSKITGRWRITSMTEWDQDFIDEEVPGYINFGQNRLGDLQFGCVRCDIDWRETERDGKPAVEFTFDGMDEMTPCSGRGWANLIDDTVDGMIFFHRGDESGFTATKEND